MISILYVSKRDESTTAEDVAAILQISRERNTSADVTGLLICTESLFAQALEGPMDDVLETLERIQHDPRHRNVALLEREEIDQRYFADWSMGFTQVDDFELAQKVTGGEMMSPDDLFPYFRENKNSMKTLMRNVTRDAASYENRFWPIR